MSNGLASTMQRYGRLELQNILHNSIQHKTNFKIHNQNSEVQYMFLYYLMKQRDGISAANISRVSPVRHHPDLASLY